MRAYMPRGHRRFLDDLEEENAAAAAAAADVRQGQGGDDGDGGIHCDGDGDCGRPSIRGYVAGLVERRGEEGAGLVVAAYDACVEALVAFRRTHLSVVNVYILRQQPNAQERGGADDPSSLGEGAGLARAAGGKGTGGTGVLEFLAPLKEETEKARLAGRSK